MNRPATCAPLCLLLACAPVATGDLNLVTVPHPGWTPEVATATVERILVEPCDGEPWAIEVGYELDLRQPEPFAVPADDYCAVGVEFADDPFDGALHLSGTTSAGVALSVDLDPGLATRERAISYDADTEGVLALDLALLFAAPTLSEVEATGNPAAVTPADAHGEALAEAVGPALIWYDSPDEASDVYIDLWPDFDFGFHAEITGCNAENHGGYVAAPADTGSDSGDTGGDSGDSGDSGGDSGGGGSSDSDGCSGCEGSGCSGGSCDSGCDATCSTLGFAPMGWGFLLALITLRRRSAGPARSDA